MVQVLEHMIMLFVLISPPVALALIGGLFARKFRYALLIGLIFGLWAAGTGLLFYDGEKHWNFWLKYHLSAFFLDCILVAVITYGIKYLVLRITGKPDRLFAAYQKETAGGRETATFVGLICIVILSLPIGAALIAGGRIRNKKQFLAACLIFMAVNLGYFYLFSKKALKDSGPMEILIVLVLVAVLPVGAGIIIRILRDRQLLRRRLKQAAAAGVDFILEDPDEFRTEPVIHGNSKAETYGFFNED